MSLSNAMKQFANPDLNQKLEDAIWAKTFTGKHFLFNIGDWKTDKEVFIR